MSKENKDNSIFTLLEATPVSLRLFLIAEAIKLPYSIYRGRIKVENLPEELVVDYGVMRLAELLEPLLR